MKVLMASDLSTGSDLALDRATFLVRQYQAQLVLLHVLEASDSSLVGALPALDRLRQEMETALRNKAASKGIQCEIRVRIGKDFVDIILEARERQVDLIIVGAHGRHYIKDALFGTTAERVISKGDRPILVVKRPAQGPYMRVLVGIDFSPESRNALEYAMKIFPQAELYILNVCGLVYEGKLRQVGLRDEEILSLDNVEYMRHLKELDRFLSGTAAYSIAKRLVAKGYPATIILAQAARLKADLIVVGTRGASGLKYILIGSVARHILRDADCDVLAVRCERPSFELP